MHWCFVQTKPLAKIKRVDVGENIDYSACVDSGSLGPEAEVNDPITGDTAVTTEMRQSKHLHAFPSSLPSSGSAEKGSTTQACFCLRINDTGLFLPEHRLRGVGQVGNCFLSQHHPKAVLQTRTITKP